MDKLSERLNELAIRVEDLEQEYEAAENKASEALVARIAEARVAARARRAQIAASVEEVKGRVSSFWKAQQKNHGASVARTQAALAPGAQESKAARTVLLADDAELWGAAALAAGAEAQDSAESLA